MIYIPLHGLLYVTLELEPMQMYLLDSVTLTVLVSAKQENDSDALVVVNSIVSTHYGS